MAQLTPDEQALMDKLTAKMNDDDAEDFEVEIFSGDRGARIPMSKAAGWLFKEFGIGEDPAAGKGDAGKGDTGKGDGKDGDGDKKPTSLFRPRGGKAAGSQS